MTDEQWKKLTAVINGEVIKPLPVGFIIDSPWLPGWVGISIKDYFSNEQMWFDANLKAVRRFPDIIFLPGFWVEFGMCTEPSAFGSKCFWRENEWPFAEKIITNIQQIHSLTKPEPAKDGLSPSVLNRLKSFHGRIEEEGHVIKFAVSRGPLNIASFLMGTTEFLTAIRTNSDEAQKLLSIITDFIIDWLKLQADAFPSIDGILILDDIVGFLGEDDFKTMVLPYLSRIFKSLDVTIKFFHNDAACFICAPYLTEIGVNLFNFSFKHTLAEMKKLTEDVVTLFGGIPSHDILAVGTPDDVRISVKRILDSVDDKSRVILSCGGGMPPGVSTENIEAFLSAVRAYS